MIKGSANFARLLQIAGCVGVCAYPWWRSLKTIFTAGPLYDQFPLTLDSGHRTEAAGPFFYDQQRETEKTWAMPPLFSYLTRSRDRIAEVRFILSAADL